MTISKSAFPAALMLLLLSTTTTTTRAWVPSSALQQVPRSHPHLTTAFSMRPDPMGPDGKPPPARPPPNSNAGSNRTPMSLSSSSSPPWRPQQQPPFQQPPPSNNDNTQLKGPRPSAPPFLPDQITEENNRRFLRLPQEQSGGFSPRGPSAAAPFYQQQQGFGTMNKDRFSSGGPTSTTVGSGRPPQSFERRDTAPPGPRGFSPDGPNKTVNNNSNNNNKPPSSSFASTARGGMDSSNTRGGIDSVSRGGPSFPNNAAAAAATPPPRGFLPDGPPNKSMDKPPSSSSSFPMDNTRGPPFPNERGPPFPNEQRGPPFPNDTTRGPPFPNDSARGPPFPNDTPRGPPLSSDTSRGPPFPNDSARGPPFPNNSPPFPPPGGRDSSYTSFDKYPSAPPMRDDWRSAGARSSSPPTSSSFSGSSYSTAPSSYGAPPSSRGTYENQPYFASTRPPLPPDMYDVAVVGGGIVGVQAALTAAATSGVERVVLIDAPSGNSGIISPRDGQDLSIGAPTGLFSKALRDASKRISVSTLRGMGLREDSVWNEVINSCLDLAQANADDIDRQLAVAGVERIRGYASFPNSGDTHTLVVQPTPSGPPGRQSSRGTQQIRADQILLATGSQPFRPPGIPFDNGDRVLDSDSINRLNFLPKSIAITGSGIIAVEYAKIFRNLGSKVTLIIRDQVPRKALEKIGLDKDIAATLVADLVRSGIQIERGAEVGNIQVPKNPRSPLTIELCAKGGGRRKPGLKQEIQCSAYLAAVGRKPNTKNLNLQAAGIRVDEYGGILVDSNLCTTAPAGNVFAAGDVLGRPFLASTGAAQGRAAVTTMFPPQQMNDPTVFPECDPDDPSCEVDGISRAGTSFDPASLAANPFAFPTGIWTSPEAAYYGLTKDQAKSRGINAGESMALYAECLRGRVFSPNGLLKLVFERPTGRMLGVHICGDDACELIHYGMELVKAGRTIQDLNNSLYSAVTFHEMYKIAAQNALDERGARKRRAAAGRALAARERDRAKRESYEF